MRISFVTGNRNKYVEVSLILSRFGIEVVQSGLKKIEIQSDDLREIVRHALEALPNSREWLLIEDDGLFIEALGGFPGPYSSYIHRTIGLRGVLKLMEGEENRRAIFTSVMGLKSPNNDFVIIEGSIEGSITTEARGSGGFGFDPIFMPRGYGRTLAELTLEEKCKISHRARALEELVKVLPKLQSKHSQ